MTAGSRPPSWVAEAAAEPRPAPALGPSGLPREPGVYAGRRARPSAPIGSPRCCSWYRAGRHARPGAEGAGGKGPARSAACHRARAADTDYTGPVRLLSARQRCRRPTARPRRSEERRRELEKFSCFMLSKVKDGNTRTQTCSLGSFYLQ